MAERDQLETYQLALSYKERAHRELAQWERIKATRELDRTQHDPVRARYATHAREADRIVEQLKRDAKNAIGPLHSQLEHAEREHRRLLRTMERSKTPPKKVNEEHRRLTQEIDRLRGDLAMSEAIHATETADSVGGFIDLPLEKYAKELDVQIVEVKAPPPRVRIHLTQFQINLLTGAVTLAVVLGVVFALFGLRGTVAAEFQAQAVEGDPMLVGVECRNVGNREIYFFAPWPGGIPDAPTSVPRRSRAFGVAVFIREKGTSTYRLLEDAGGVWKYRGTLLQAGEYVEIAPGRRAAVYLDLELLEQQTGILVDGLRLEFSRHGGSEKKSYLHTEFGG